VTAADARKLVRQAGLTGPELGQILDFINTRPDTTLQLFEDLEDNEVADTVRSFLKRQAGKCSQQLPVVGFPALVSTASYG
jgi:hypothetical protein